MVKDRFVWGANSNENYSADKRSSFHMNPQNPYAPAAPRTAPRAPAPGARPWVCLVPNPEQRGQGHGWDGMGGGALHKDKISLQKTRNLFTGGRMLPTSREGEGKRGR